MTLEQTTANPEIAIVPLVAKLPGESEAWLGAVLAKLLHSHLAGVQVALWDFNEIALHLEAKKYALPLDKELVRALQNQYKLRALIHGSYVKDVDGGLLAFKLRVDAPDLPGIPLEVAAPLNAFDRFIKRVSVSLLEALGLTITDDLRQRINGVGCPSNFQAIEQMARAHAAWTRGQNELALTALESALTLDPSYDEAAAMRVAVARSVADPEGLREAFRVWATIPLKTGKTTQAAERLLMIGGWMAGRGDWGEARSAYKDARNLFKREKDERGQLQATNNMANLEMLQGKNQEAIQVFRRSLPELEALPDALLDLAQTYFNLAVAHKQLGQRDEAQMALTEASLIARRLRATALEARCLVQLGAIRDDRGEWAQANQDYEKAIQLFNVVDDPHGVAQAKSQRAILLRQQGMLDQAVTLMTEALRTYESTESYYDQAVLWFNLAEVYLAMDLVDQAWDYALQARDAFKALKVAALEQAEELVEWIENLPEEEDEQALDNDFDGDTPPLSGPLADRPRDGYLNAEASPEQADSPSDDTLSE
ncbi:MAG: tetratricopeptide repeat protein [Chloroflexi bacterium]|nr:tetratricopeptide repeat protein [Chloroflexota bacterium]